MNQFLSALAVSVSLLALICVGFFLMSDVSAPGTGVDQVEFDSLLARLSEMEGRLEGLTSDPSTRPSLVRGPATPSGDADVGEENVELAEGDDSPTAKDALLVRLEAIETRLLGLEEDPMQRGYTFLQSESAELRKRGIHSLKSLARNDPEARAALREMLADSDVGVRVTALNALAEINDKEAIPLAANLLNDDSAEVRRTAIGALTRLKATEAGADIASFIGDEDEKVRWMAVDSVGKLGHKASAQALLYALEDESAGIRGEAISSLGEIGATESLPQLRDLYRNVTAEGARDNPDHRFRLAYAMKQLGDPSVVRIEITRLGDTVLNGENDRARGGALRGLMWLGRDEPSARAIFEEAAKDSNDWIRREARRALEEGKGE